MRNFFKKDGLLDNYFEISKNGSNTKREIVAGLTTFMTMAYILIVNPSILAAAGMDQGAVFTATAGLIYKKNKSKKGAIIGAVVGSVVMGIVSFPSNLFIVYPAFTKFMPMEAIIGAYSELLPSVGKLWQALLIFNVPFTIVKGLISTLITVLIYKRLSPVLKGRG